MNLEEFQEHLFQLEKDMAHDRDNAITPENFARIRIGTEQMGAKKVLVITFEYRPPIGLWKSFRNVGMAIGYFGGHCMEDNKFLWHKGNRYKLEDCEHDRKGWFRPKPGARPDWDSR